VTPHPGAHAVTELSMQTQPGADLAPGAPGRSGRLPRRQVMRHQAPGTAAAPPVLDAIAPLAPGVFPRSPPRLFRRPEGLQALPRLIASIRGRGQAPS
jgi:hypothetical protein